MPECKKSLFGRRKCRFVDKYSKEPTVNADGIVAIIEATREASLYSVDPEEVQSIIENLPQKETYIGSVCTACGKFVSANSNG